MAELNLAESKTFTITTKDLEPLFKYLASRPFGEVSQLINEFAAALKEEDANS
jgi:hypothetical protein